MPTMPACDPSVSIAPLARWQHRRDLGAVRPGVGAEVSCSWMGLAIGRREPLFADVRVTLGGRNIGMPKKLLNGSEVGAAIKKMGSKSVTERVRMGGRCTSAIKNASNIT